MEVQFCQYLMFIPFSGFYKLNVDAPGPIEDDKWGIGVVVRDNEGVVVGASSWQVFSLPNSEVAKDLAMRKGLEFAKDMSFLNLIAESYASNVVLALNVHNNLPTMLALLFEIVLVSMVVFVV